MNLNKNNILIVGGGTAGLISALIIKTRFSNLKVDVVKSDNIGIIGVGEGSTEHWKEFMDFCKISLIELIKETDATFKYGIMFEGWTKNLYFHNVTANINDIKFGQYLAGYAHAIINDLKPKEYTNGHCFINKVLKNDFPNQFHFNTFKLNKFLLKKCSEININIFEDEITKVKIIKNNIDYIESKNKKYKYDFYIDSTGFKKILISKLNCKWNSYKEYLPMNEAIAFPTKDTDEYIPYTLSKAMSSGWMWRIPTFGRWGNGYVFNNNYINAEKAKKECEDYLGYKVEIAKNIKFEAGALDKAWIGNCVAIGLSSSFIEPLEASSIGTSIQQSFLLMHVLINYKQTDIDFYIEKTL
jgi:tryptophan halogenase